MAVVHLGENGLVNHTEPHVWNLAHNLYIFWFVFFMFYVWDCDGLVSWEGQKMSRMNLRSVFCFNGCVPISAVLYKVPEALE